MPKILVLYYSMYGHVETMAGAEAEGARSIAETEVVIKRVPEVMPPDVAKKAGAKLDQNAPICTVAELPDYDAIIFGTPTRFGNMAAQMRNFLDQTGGQWMQGKLIGKVRQRLHFDSDAARRSGDHDHFLPQHIVASWLHHRRYALFVPRVAQHG